MLPFFFKKNSDQDHELQKTLSLIQSLVFGLPFLCFMYLQYKEEIHLTTWQVAAFAFILMIVLAGLVVLRQFFERFSAFSDMVKKAADGQMELAAYKRPSGDLTEMAGDFGNVLQKMERTNEELSRKVAGLSVMKELLNAVDDCPDMDGLLRILLEKSMVLSGAVIGSIFTLDLKSGHLRLVHYQGPGTPPPENFPVDDNSPVLYHVVQKKEPLLVGNIETDPRIRLINNPKYGTPSFLSLPVFAGKNFLGVLSLARKENNKPFDKEDEHLLSLVVGEMGFALQNAHLQAICKKQSKEIDETNIRAQAEVNARKKAEAEKNQLATQMIHAEKMQAIGTLAGGIAHDFNNLLMAIQGNVSLMLLSSNPEVESYQKLKSIEKQVVNGARLTGQLLGFARKGGQEFRPVRLNRVVREASEIFARTRKDISVHLDLSKNLAQIRADQSQMEQVMWNLFVNASDAMPEGGNLYLKTINISRDDIKRSDISPKPEDYVRLLVKDTGTGIDPEIIKRIFEPFFTTKEIGKGTGLGLASVCGILKAHGGYMDANSEPGKGAVFSIYLPASKTTALPARPTANTPVLGKGAILLVDDEDSVRNVGDEMLTSLGYKVYSVSSGKQAIEVFKKHYREINVVILDLVMPELSGAATLEGLKAVDPDVQVLLASGFDENDESVDLLKKGCLDFIQKPFSINLLSEVLHDILS